jgi:hypothetical protein
MVPLNVFPPVFGDDAQRRAADFRFAKTARGRHAISWALPMSTT